MSYEKSNRLDQSFELQNTWRLMGASWQRRDGSTARAFTPDMALPPLDNKLVSRALMAGVFERTPKERDRRKRQRKAAW